MPSVVAVTSCSAPATGPVTSSAAPRTPAKVLGATNESVSRTSPTMMPARTARKLKNSPYCARRDQPGRAVATFIGPLCCLQDAAELLFLQRAAGAERDAGERVVGDSDGKACFVAQHFVQSLEERAAAGKDDALVAN